MTPREQIKQMLEQATASEYGEVTYHGPMPGEPNVKEVHYTFGYITDNPKEQEAALEQFRKDFLKKLKIPSGKPTINLKIDEERIQKRQLELYDKYKRKQLLKQFQSRHFFFLFNLPQSA